ncbi:MAG: hypothetical protein A2857_03665 [Candidatus Levybacteria bacterium RIFCSPHIGHO2_01_FULL_36_15]|nr:MAG: hypothetical protein A2857_03665 [Candidatus Levybacteria bacterium RIFCSPHIGHO2_01_FULL_36_15]OGH37236.1 MAG: hypothetical protein A2905_06055 [Candidatus Levybacteria bacterium RIFCSPLOWO2_01_FULL_36_10]
MKMAGCFDGKLYLSLQGLKSVILLIIITFLSYLFLQNSNAQSKNFQVSIQSVYTVMPDDFTHVVQKTYVKNLTDFYYMPSYNLTSGIKDIRNLKANSLSGSIPFEISQSEDITAINFTFPTRVIGKNKENIFNINFDSSSVTRKSGDVLEMTIPGLANPSDFYSYDITINVPKDFGGPSIIKPFKAFDSNATQYTFNKNDIGKSGIYMIFGKAQFYRFNVVYHISNPNLFPVKTEIALPPSTNYQDILIKSLKPEPIDVYEDSDGNWLALYTLGPQKKQNINLTGMAKIYSSPKQEFLPTSKRLTYLEAKNYWEANDPSIKKLSETLKTPREVYDFVVNKLSYNFDKISIGNNPRKGAKKTLANPDYSVCLEFTDLFVAIARTAGIPARSVEGFAYTDNSKLKPLSLVKDILHAWPQYYDDVKKTWVMVDPTWGNTTGGIDYFDSLDLEHFAFVIKGVDSSYPIPAGGYKDKQASKDVEVLFAKQEDFDPKTSVVLTDDIPSSYLSGLPLSAHVKIKNTGNTAIKNKKLQVISDFSSEPQNFNIDSIPPYGSKSYEVKFGASPLLTNRAYQVKILLEGTSINRKVNVSIVPEKIFLLTGGGIFVAIILILTISFKTRRLSVPR